MRFEKTYSIPDVKWTNVFAEFAKWKNMIADASEDFINAPDFDNASPCAFFPKIWVK